MSILKFSAKGFSLMTVLLCGAISCTKKQSTPEIAINFSKVSASQTNTLDMIIINLRNNNQLRAFEFDCDSNTPVDPCAEILFDKDLVEGPAFIQILAVTESALGVNNIFYGDVAANLKGGANRFEIPVNLVANFSDEGKVSGRYVPSAGHALANHFLTGQVEARVSISDDKPPMKIMEFEIFGGWFNLFLLDNVSFRFFFTGDANNAGVVTQHQNVEIFNDLYSPTELGLNLNSSGLQPNAATIAKFDSSLQYYDYYQNSTSDQVTQRNFESRTLGFFGSNPGSKNLCSEQLASGTLLDGNNGTARVCKVYDFDNNQCSTYFQWSDITAVPSNFDGSVDNCTGSVSETAIDLARVAEGGFGHSLGNIGPFIENDSLGLQEIIDLDTDASPMTLSWSLAEGVHLPLGVEVFVIDNNSSYDPELVRPPRSDGVLCENLTQPGVGFTSLGVIPAQSGVLNSVNIPAAFDSAFRNGAALPILCPLRPDGSYYRTVLEGHKYINDNSSPVSLSLVKVPSIDGESGVMYQNTCYPVELDLRDTGDQSAFSADPVHVNLNDSGSGDFYENLDRCNNAVAGQEISDIYIHHRMVLYFRHTSTLSNNFNIQAVDADSNLANSTPFAYHSLAPETATEVRILTDFMRDTSKLEISSGEKCVPIYVGTFVDAGGGKMELTKSTHSITLDGTPTLGSGSLLISGSLEDCLQGSSVSGFGMSNFSLRQFWVTPSGYTGTSANLFSACGGGLSCAATSVNEVATTNSADKFKVQILGDNWEPGGCYPVRISYVENNFDAYPANFMATGSLTFGYVAGEPRNYIVHNESTCAGGGIISMPSMGFNIASAPTTPIDTVYIEPQGGDRIAMEANFGTDNNSDSKSLPELDISRLYVHDSNGNSVLDFGTIAFGVGSADIEVTLENLDSTANIDVTVNFNGSSAYSFAPGGGIGDSGRCSSNGGDAHVPMNGSCTLVIRFAPPSQTFYGETIEFEVSTVSVGRLRVEGTGS